MTASPLYFGVKAEIAFGETEKGLDFRRTDVTADVHSPSAESANSKWTPVWRSDVAKVELHERRLNIV